MKILVQLGYTQIIMCDSTGIIYKGREKGMNPVKETIADLTNSIGLKGSLRDAMEGADVFIGVSVANLLTKDLVDLMSRDSIIFAMANPVPEISYENAKEWGVRIIATGRSDYPNQVNNVLAFPGIFRGTLDAKASEINDDMKLAAVQAIANLIEEKDLSNDYIIPQAFDKRVVQAVSQEVSKVAIESGVSKLSTNSGV